MLKHDRAAAAMTLALAAVKVGRNGDEPKPVDDNSLRWAVAAGNYARQGDRARTFACLAADAFFRGQRVGRMVGAAYALEAIALARACFAEMGLAGPSDSELEEVARCVCTNCCGCRCPCHLGDEA